MSNVVQFLEMLGRNPQPRSEKDIVSSIESAQLEPRVKKALLDGDTVALNRALGTDAAVLCFILPAENDEPQEDTEQEGEDGAQEREASVLAA